MYNGTSDVDTKKWASSIEWTNQNVLIDFPMLPMYYWPPLYSEQKTKSVPPNDCKLYKIASENK